MISRKCILGFIHEYKNELYVTETCKRIVMRKSASTDRNLSSKMKLLEQETDVSLIHAFPATRRNSISSVYKGFA
jgi:hypothetical protein